jgi:Domain of unknown function (DUF1737)
MQYDVIHDLDLGNLVTTVNRLIQKGWEPLGGIAVLSSPESMSGKIFYQAIIKR